MIQRYNKWQWENHNVSRMIFFSPNFLIFYNHSNKNMKLSFYFYISIMFSYINQLDSDVTRIAVAPIYVSAWTASNKRIDYSALTSRTTWTVYEPTIYDFHWFASHQLAASHIRGIISFGQRETYWGRRRVQMTVMMIPTSWNDSILNSSKSVENCLFIVA